MKKVAIMLISLLLISVMFGSISSSKISINTNIENQSMESTHKVFVEIGTAQLCEPCDGWSQSVYDAYTSGDYNFDYVEMIIYDHAGQKLNNEAYAWSQSYNILGFPTLVG